MDIDNDDEVIDLTQAENDLLTQTGPGTPGGRLLRSYWQPVAASEEMPIGGAPMPVRIMSEDLVLFRDDADRLGLIGVNIKQPAVIEAAQPAILNAAIGKIRAVARGR